MAEWRAREETEALSELCEHIIGSGNLASFCREKGLKYVTMLDWINESSRRTELYARAREDRADLLAEEIVAISDESKDDTYTDENGNVRTNNEVVQRSRLRVDARKWYAAKVKPRVYGDKLLVGKEEDHRKLTDDQLIAALSKYGIAVQIGPEEEAQGA